MSLLSIKERAFCIDPFVLACLLVIRQASKTFIPFHKQLTIDELLVEKNSNEKSNQTPWDIIANPNNFRNSEHISLLTSAMCMLEPKPSHLNILIEDLQSAKIDVSAFYEIIKFLSSKSLNDISLSSIHEQCLCKNNGNLAYRYEVFYTPTNIVQCLLQLLDIKGNVDVYDPCCGSGAMLYGVAQYCHDKRLQLFGQTTDLDSYKMCQTYFSLQGLNIDLGGKPANSLLNDLHNDRQFDYIISNPPFNLSDWCDHISLKDERWKYGMPPQKNANFAWLQHIISHLKEGGRAVLLLPNGTLTTQNHAEYNIRQRILHAHLVESIIALPSGLFHNTKIPCCIWMLHKSSNQEKMCF